MVTRNSMTKKKYIEKSLYFEKWNSTMNVLVHCPTYWLKVDWWQVYSKNEVKISNIPWSHPTMAVGRKFSYFLILCANYPPWMKYFCLHKCKPFSVLDEEQGQEDASSRTNKRGGLDVVQVCSVVWWIKYAFVFPHWSIQALHFLPCCRGRLPLAFCWPVKFRGDLVELVKGPDKGKLGIIKMIVQVGKKHSFALTMNNIPRNVTGWLLRVSIWNMKQLLPPVWLKYSICVIYLKYETDDFPGTSVASEMPLLVTTDIKLVDPSTEQVDGNSSNCKSKN